MTISIQNSNVCLKKEREKKIMRETSFFKILIHVTVLLLIVLRNLLHNFVWLPLYIAFLIITTFNRMRAIFFRR